MKECSFMKSAGVVAEAPYSREKFQAMPLYSVWQRRFRKPLHTQRGDLRE